MDRGIRQIAHSLDGEMARRVAFEVRKTQRRIVTFCISFFLMALAFIFLTLGAVYLGIEYLALSKTLAFLMVGTILLVMGVIVKLTD